MKRALRLATAVVLAGCGRHEGGPNPAPSASAGTSLASASTSASESSASAARDDSSGTGGALMAPAKCRAIAVKGTVTATGGAPLVLGASLDRAGWVDLADGATLAVKNAETSRELVFAGPARLLPCDRGEERFLMPEGGAQTSTWAGARPGAEVLIATPFGTVRYGDAKLDVHVDPKALTVTSEIGDAWVWLGGAAAEEKIPAGKRFEKRGHAPDVKGLVADCEKRAEDAETRARAVLVPGASSAPLGARAAEHVRARKAARLSCASAASAVQTAKTDADKDALGRRVSYADARWRSVPPLGTTATASAPVRGEGAGKGTGTEHTDPAQKVESR